jgi:hypothetical protein
MLRHVRYFSVFLLDFGIVPTVWYFGIAMTVWYFWIAPTVWYFGIAPTVWYFGIAPTVWHVLLSVYYINPTQSKFTFKHKCH